MPAMARAADGWHRQWHVVGLLAVIAIAAAVRFHALGRQPLWNDEAFGWWHIRESWHHIWVVLPATDGHPPLYLALLKLWSGLFGTSEAGLRGLSAIASLATVPVMYACGHRLGRPTHGPALGLSAAIMCALAPVQVEYAQEARAYAVIGLCTAIGLWSMLRLVCDAEAARWPWLGWSAPVEVQAGRLWATRLAWLGLAFSLAVALWLHLMNVLLVAAFGLCGVLVLGLGQRWSRAAAANFGLASLIVGLLWLPQLSMILRQASGYSDFVWIGTVTWNDVQRTADFLFAVRFLRWPVGLMLTAGSCLAGLGIFMIACRRSGVAGAALAILILFPLPGAIALSWLFEPVLVDRTLLWAALPYYLAVAAGLVLPWRGQTGMAPVLLLAAVLAVGTGRYYTAKVKEPWDRLVATIKQDFRPGDLVIAHPKHVQDMVQYYAERQGGWLPLIGLPLLTEPGAVIDLVTDEEIPILRDKLRPHPRVWLVTRQPEFSDPDGKVMRLLRSEFTLTYEERFFRRYMWLHLFERQSAGEPR